MRSVVEIGASVPAFLGKLWKLVNDSETNHLISWSPGGKTFVIHNQADFARDLLPLYYKHNNMASFIRQLNMYGFHKITSVENGGLRYEKDEIEFSHPCFMRSHAYLLEHIKRKIANPKSIVASNESGEKIILKPELMNKVLSDVKQMKGKQESLDAKFSAMKQENEALWREVAILRQKHIKQQQIVNNLIQFLMSLVQPTRPSNTSANNVGVKRPYQLMINSAAHNSSDSYPGRLKSMKLDKDSVEEAHEDNMEDGPTIHELGQDDMQHSENMHDPLDPINFVSVNFTNSPSVPNTYTTADEPTSTQYEVTLEDGDDLDLDGTRLVFTVDKKNNLLGTAEYLPKETSPLPTLQIPKSPLHQTQTSLEQAIHTNATSPGPSKGKPKIGGKTGKNNTLHTKLLSLSNYNSNPPSDFKLPAEIFASDDSVSNTGDVGVDEEFILPEANLTNESSISAPKDQMLGGLNIKIEKPLQKVKSAKKSKSKDKVDQCNIDLANIKTELQDDIDLNNMTLATVNNNSNVNRVQSVFRRDNINQKWDDYSSLLGSNSNKNDIDDHLDSMQTDLDSLRELLRSDSYSLDTNTLLGNKYEDWMQARDIYKLFGSDDPFYGLSFNPAEDRTKLTNNAEGNQLISYTGNIPDLEYISLPELDCDSSQEELAPSPSSSTLNTPQVQMNSPSYNLRP